MEVKHYWKASEYKHTFKTSQLVEAMSIKTAFGKELRQFSDSVIVTHC
jgi:hypothetical protein